MINKCTFIGRTTKDIELKESNGKKFAKLTIACDNGKDSNGKDRPSTFVNLTAFNKEAEKFAAHVVKGSLVYVEAVYESGSYEKDGNKIYYHDFKIMFSRILSSNKKNGAQQQNNYNEYPNENFGGPYPTNQPHYNGTPPQNDPFNY